MKMINYYRMKMINHYVIYRYFNNFLKEVNSCLQFKFELSLQISPEFM